MKTHNPPELLSPAGTKESVLAAVNNGCDAVYIGGKKFSARKYAENFSVQELAETIDFCHIRGVKVFITVNILYKNSELQELLDFVSEMYSAGADGFIIQDLGTFDILKKNFPDIRLHASTQMTAHSLETVKFLNNIGFSRIVLSRELSLEEIAYICTNSSAEIEVFVHGALCVSYSGRCLMSSFIGNRSGNRGQCAQPCRLKYSLYHNDKKITENYLLCPKDIMTLSYIDRLVKYGVNSFKIEGRMKSPEYAALTTRIYRKYIDLSTEKLFHSPSEEDIKNLTGIFSRGGSFSEGYLKTWSNSNMISCFPKSVGTKVGIVKSYDSRSKKTIILLSDDLIPGDGIEIWTDTEPHAGTGISKQAKAGDTISLKIKGNIKKGNYVYKSFDKTLVDSLKKEYKNDLRKTEIHAEATAKIDTPLKLSLRKDNITITVFGAFVAAAEKNPVTKDELEKRFSKTGDTPYSLIFDKIICDDNIYIPLKDIASLKREALLALSEKITDSFKKERIKISYSPKKRAVSENKYITVYLNTKEQFYCSLSYNIKRIYFELNNTLIKNCKEFIDLSHKNNIEFFICFPRIYRKSFYKDFSELYCKFEKSDADGYLLRNFTEIKTNKKTAADYTFNIFNSASANFALSYFDEITLSPELTADELKEIAEAKTEILIYGRPTLMTTHLCPVGLHSSGKKSSSRFCPLKNNSQGYYLKDRLGAFFPIQTDCLVCASYILGKSPVCVLNRFDEVSSIPAEYFRIILTDEPADISEDIIYSHTRLLSGLSPDRRTENTIKRIKEKGIDSGHFFKEIL